MLPPGTFGKGPIVDHLRFDGNFFFGTKSADCDPFFYYRIGRGQVGIILITIDAVKSLRRRMVELQKFFQEADANLALVLQKQDCAALTAEHPNDFIRLLLDLSLLGAQADDRNEDEFRRFFDG